MIISFRYVPLRSSLLTLALMVSLPAVAQQHPMVMHAPAMQAITTSAAVTAPQIAQMQQQLAQQQSDIATLKAALARIESSPHTSASASSASHGRVTLSKRPPSPAQSTQTLSARSTDISARLRAMPPLTVAAEASSGQSPTEGQIAQLTTQVNNLQTVVRELSEVQTGQQLTEQANHQQSVHNSQMNSNAVAAAYALACSMAYVPSNSAAGQQPGWTQWMTFQAAFDNGGCTVATESVR